MFDDVEPCTLLGTLARRTIMKRFVAGTSRNLTSAEIVASSKKKRKGHVLLDELPEDVLDAVLSYLDATSLYFLSQ